MVGKLGDLLFQFVNYFFSIIALILPVLLIILVWRFGHTFAVYYGDRVGERVNRKRRFKRIGDDSDYPEVLHKIRTLHPKEFEYYIADLLTKNGFITRVTGGHGKPDGGVDIIARREDRHYLVQCKKFIDADVSVRHLREFYGVGADLKYAKDVKLMFVSTTYFTKAAKDFAKQKDIELIDADQLLELVFAQEIEGKKVEFNGLERSEVMRHVPPSCPVCTRSLVWRQGPHGSFIGCTGYPSCRYVYASSESDPE